VARWPVCAASATYATPSHAKESRLPRRHWMNRSARCNGPLNDPTTSRHDSNEPSAGEEPASRRQEGLPVDAVSIAGGRVYWIEGRNRGDVLLMWSAGTVTEALPAGTHVASEVHEYGGGAYLVSDGEVWFVRAEINESGTDHGTLHPVTPEPARGQHRHA